MKRIFLLLFIAILTLVVILFLRQPDLLNDIWLWIVGLIGTIIAFFQRGVEYFKSLFSEKKPKENTNATSTSTNQIPEENSTANMNEPVTSFTQTVNPPTDIDDFVGIKLSVLRFSDNSNTTVGLLYINDKFYCYTLEDTFRTMKVKGKTRIPAGIYDVDFRREESELQKKYKKQYDWFTWHLQILNVPEFQYVYIHSGGDHTHTEGCLLVSDSISVGNSKTFLTNSRKTFQKLYQYLEQEIEKGIPVRLYINDENWFEKHI